MKSMLPFQVVGLRQLTELTESQGEQIGEPIDPSAVVDILQLIFDRFDALADTFKVQKIRKTVNEFYMVAAGLPDPHRIEDPTERALAIAALAFSMVRIRISLFSTVVRAYPTHVSCIYSSRVDGCQCSFLHCN